MIETSKDMRSEWFSETDSTNFKSLNDECEQTSLIVFLFFQLKRSTLTRYPQIQKLELEFSRNVHAFLLLKCFRFFRKIETS
jgi:hypothetical protein